jgi:hypothetical protein
VKYTSITFVGFELQIPMFTCEPKIVQALKCVAVGFGLFMSLLMFPKMAGAHGKTFNFIRSNVATTRTFILRMEL